MEDEREKKNARLLMAMHALQSEESAGAQERLLNELIHHAELYLPVKQAKDGEDTRIAFAVVNDGQKHHYYALFTSRERAQAWRESEQEFAVVNFPKLASMCMGDPRISGVVINANTENLILGRKLLSDANRMLQAELMGQKAVPAAEPVMFREPSGEYTEMLEAVREYIREDRNISAAYLREAEIGGELCYVFIVNHIGSMQPSFANITTVAQDFRKERRPVAVMSARAPEAEAVIKDILPFYRRPFVIS